MVLLALLIMLSTAEMKLPSSTDNGVDLTARNDANRDPENEVTSYVRYVLENQQPRNVTLTELDGAGPCHDAAPTGGEVNVWDGHIAT